MPTLTNVAIEPTNKCNLNCKMCFAHGPHRKLGDMSWENFEKIVKELEKIPTIGAVSLNFGGEPLLHPEFGLMLRRIAGHGWRTGFATNAMFLTPKISQQIIATQVTQVDIGLDAVGKKVEALRAGTSYQLIKANIRTLVAMRNAVDSQFPLVGINCAFTEDHLLEDILALVSEMGPIVDMIRILPARTDNLTFQHQELFNQTMPPEEFCGSPDYYMGILWNGDVVPCCWDLSAKTVMGNVFEEGVLGVFNNERYKSLRELSHHGFKVSKQESEMLRDNSNCPRSYKGLHRCIDCKVWQKRLITGVGRMM